MMNLCDHEAKKGMWNKEEDDKLVAYIKRYGIWNWTHMPKAAGLARSGKSCRLRWMNYLRPNLRHGNFTPEEEDEIIRQHRLLGNRWAAIAAKLPGRTDNDVKNYWNTRLKRRVCTLDGEVVNPEQASGHDLLQRVDHNGPSHVPNSAETPDSDGSRCSQDRFVIPESSCDIPMDDLLGGRSEEEIESLWPELPPLGNQDTVLGHHFLEASDNWYDYYSNQDMLSSFEQHSDHAGASSSNYQNFYVDEFSIDLWGSQ